MADMTKDNILVIRNLRDAGCGSSMIEQFLRFKKEGKRKEALCLLSCQRHSLLEKVHENQKKLDCLDFLIFKIKKETV